MSVDHVPGPPGDITHDGSQARVIDVFGAPAPGAHDVMMVAWLARDVRVLACRKVDPLHELELGEDVERPKDGRSPDARPI